ncbi:hypothetical protein AUC70_03115 [Methyloceanibacter stevinii]|uniref:Glycosyltransferase 2-like domain-containing protein n=1 Tax=Methyloceanibacter stevinii TaxID=1774970 RepID=A0A1E3VQR0_9HYPH|nr:glycosyltransferase family 2 protein [Methyloceanibacter stevinii]ODR95864.1 hypothetical protein AUC70_03115 [Methyloceanibacter stevinii]
MTAQPLVTIITPCLNRAGMIATAVQSVRDQDYGGGIQHLVMDGGSRDGTLDVLAHYPQVTVISEPDGGLYDALNKGIARAQGSIIGLLNSDDTYRPVAVRAAVAVLQDQPFVSMACGGATVVDRDGEPGTVIRHYDGAENRSLEPRDLLLGVPIVNARFYRRALFDAIGRFETRYRIVADRDFLLRAALAGETAATIPEVVYEYGSHCGSLTIGGIDARRRIAEETIALTESWLSRTPPVPASAARSLKRLHAQCMLICMADGARRGDFGSLRECLRRGTKLNGTWPINAVGALGAWAARRIWHSGV